LRKQVPSTRSARSATRRSVGGGGLFS